MNDQETSGAVAEVTVLRPSDLEAGDVLLVRAPQPQTPQHLAALTEYLRELSSVTGCAVFYAPPLVEILVSPRETLPAEAQPMTPDSITH